jgi:hypothetical protein
LRELPCFFSGVDGGDIPDIPSVGFGVEANTERNKKMKQFLKMTAAPAALFTLAFVTMATPAAAYEYCRQDITSGMRSCSFTTLEQCQAMSSGRGGDCYRDPFLSNSSSAYAYQPKQPLSKPGVRAKTPGLNR